MKEKARHTHQQRSASMDSIAETCRKSVLSRLVSNLSTPAIGGSSRSSVSLLSSANRYRYNCVPTCINNNEASAVLSIIRNVWENEEEAVKQKNMCIDTNTNSVGHTHKEGEAWQRCGRDFQPSDQAIELGSPNLDIATCTKKIETTAVMTQTEISNIEDEYFRFPSGQQLEKKLKLLQQRYDEELRQQEIMYSLQSQGSLQKEMMSFEAECEIKMQKQMQRVCTKLVDDVRIEEAIKYKQELEILRIQVEGRNIERIQQTVSEERTRYLKHLELFQEENNMRQQEHENWLCEVSKQKHNMEIERMALEAQKNKLAWEEEVSKKRISDFENRCRDVEMHEAAKKHMIEFEYRRVQDDARKTCEAEMKALASQRDFFNKAVIEIQRERQQLSLYHSDIAENKLKASKIDQAMASLHKENSSLQGRLQGAENQLSDIGTIIGDKQNLVSTCCALVKSCKDTNSNLYQSQLEVKSIRRIAKEESDHLKKKFSITENELSRAQGLSDRLLSKVEILENEVKSSRTECTETGSLLRECQMILESLGGVQWNENNNGWCRSSNLNARCAANLNVSSYPSTRSLLLQRRPPHCRVSVKQKPLDSLGPHLDSFNARYLDNGMGDRAQNYSRSLAGQTAAFPGYPSCYSACVSSGDNKCKIKPTLPAASSNDANDVFTADATRENCRSVDDIIDESNNYSLKKVLHQKNQPVSEMKILTPHLLTSKLGLLSSCETDDSGMKKNISEVINPIDYLTLKVDEEDNICGDEATIELHEETFATVGLQTNRFVAVGGMKVIALESEPFDGVCTNTSKIAQGASNKICIAIKESNIESTEKAVAPSLQCNTAGDKLKPLLIEPIHDTRVTESQTFDGDSSEIRKRNGCSTIHQTCSNMELVFLEKNRSLAKEIVVPTIPLKTVERATNDELASDDPQIVDISQHDHLFEMHSVGYALSEFDEETMNEVADTAEIKDGVSACYSMNWSKEEVEESTVISTELEESQEDGTISMEVISAYYESSVDDNDNNW